MFKLTGTLKVLNPTVQVSEKFSKREFVITESSSMYPQDIMFQLSQDKCSLLDGYNVNDQVEVSFNLRGREWTSPQGEVKFFNTLDAWRIDRVNAVPKSQPEVTTPTASDAVGEDDLPF